MKPVSLHVARAIVLAAVESTYRGIDREWFSLSRRQLRILARASVKMPSAGFRFLTRRLFAPRLRSGLMRFDRSLVPRRVRSLGHDRLATVAGKNRAAIYKFVERHAA